jgi:hypothetical protein
VNAVGGQFAKKVIIILVPIIIVIVCLGVRASERESERERRWGAGSSEQPPDAADANVFLICSYIYI